MDKGSYSLLIEVQETTTVAVGALGDTQFRQGYYLYSGSAFGPGGFKRIERHRDTFTSGTDSPHWHIDYLANADASQLLDAFITPESDIECRISQEIDGRPVEGFGCSDCDCISHLHYVAEKNEAVETLQQLHERRFG